jgi:glycosyltransferase involved in cell wall biosynthesis
MKIFLFNYLDLLCAFCSSIYVITAGMNAGEARCPVIFKDLGLKLHYVKDIRPRSWSIMLWVLKIFTIQLKMTAELFRSRQVTDVFIFCGTANFLLPMLLAKVFRKKTSVLAWGLGFMSREKMAAKRTVTENLNYHALKLSERAILRLADQINVESKSVISFLEINEYADKIAINGAPYIDRDVFSATVPFNRRPNVVGYVGRLEMQKGIMNFVRAIPLLHGRAADLRFVIIGDGILRAKISDELQSGNVRSVVKCTGWVPREELPRYLNGFRILVFPSYSEGLPGVVQEAMACGVAVLATRVGAIPDLIVDGETGFILEDNSPEGIAENVLRILKRRDLEAIAERAEALIENEYVYDKMMQKCAESLAELVQ